MLLQWGPSGKVRRDQASKVRRDQASEVPCFVANATANQSLVIG